MTRRSVGERVAATMRRLLTFRRVTVVVFRHRTTTRPASPARVVAVTAENVADALAMEPPERIETFREFLARGDLGFYAYLDDRVVHRAWVRRGPVRVPTWHAFAPLEVGEGEAWIHYCETAATARGKGIYPAVLADIVERLEASGVREVIIATEETNVASRHGIEKAGFSAWCRLCVTIAFGGLWTRTVRTLPDGTA